MRDVFKTWHVRFEILLLVFSDAVGKNKKMHRHNETLPSQCMQKYSSCLTIMNHFIVLDKIYHDSIYEFQSRSMCEFYFICNKYYIQLE